MIIKEVKTMNDSQIMMIVNASIIIILLMNIFRCGRKGFILSLWECIGTVVALIAAWNFSPLMGRMFHLVPLSYTPMGDTAFGPMINDSLNRFVWVLVIFLVIKLVMLILKPIIEFIGKIPLLKEINQLIGCIFGGVITMVWALLAVFVLSVPVFEQGEKIVDGTFLKPIKVISVAFLESMHEEMQENEILSKIISGEMIDAEDEAVIEKWMIEYHLDEQSIKAFFNK